MPRRRPSLVARGHHHRRAPVLPAGRLTWRTPLGAAATAAIVGISLRSAWLALTAAAVWLAADLIRRWLGRDTEPAARLAERIQPGISGAVAALAYSTVYIPQIILPWLASSVGAGPDALRFVPGLAIAGFVVGNVGNLVLRRRLRWVPKVRTALLGVGALALVAMALARSTPIVEAVTVVSTMAGAVGPLLRSEAAAVRLIGGGGGMGPASTAFFATVALTLVAPAVLPSPTSLSAHDAPARPFLVALALVWLAAMRLLPALLERKPEVWEGRVTRLRDRHLWRASILTTVSLMSFIPVETRITFILGRHGVQPAVTIASVLQLSILVAGILGIPWHVLLNRSLPLAEFLGIGTNMLALAIGWVADWAGLTGASWTISFALATAVGEISTSLVWDATEFEALKDPTDIGRSALLNIIRYGATEPVALLAAQAPGSELLSVWTPGVGLAALALILQVAWLGPSEAKHRRQRLPASVCHLDL
jgi:hypothetical protein